MYDGAIDMLITELKSNAFKPKEYRKSRMFLPSTSQSSLGSDVHSNNMRRWETVIEWVCVHTCTGFDLEVNF